MEDKIKKAIEEVRPALQADGGDIEFVALEENIVKIRLMGTCYGCPMAHITLKNGVENYLQENVDKNLVVEHSDE